MISQKNKTQKTTLNMRPQISPHGADELTTTEPSNQNQTVLVN